MGRAGSTSFLLPPLLCGDILVEGAGGDDLFVLKGKGGLGVLDEDGPFGGPVVVGSMVEVWGLGFSWILTEVPLSLETREEGYEDEDVLAVVAAVGLSFVVVGLITLLEKKEEVKASIILAWRGFCTSIRKWCGVEKSIVGFIKMKCIRK